MPTKAKQIEDGIELALVLGGLGLAAMAAYKAWQARKFVERQASVSVATTQNETIGQMVYDATHGIDYTGPVPHPTALQAAEAVFLAPVTAWQAYEGYQAEQDAQREARRAARQAAREAAGSSSPSVQAAATSRGGAAVSGQHKKPAHHWWEF